VKGEEEDHQMINLENVTVEEDSLSGKTFSVYV